MVQAGHQLVGGTDGLAPVEARTQLDVATQTLERDVNVVQLSQASGPAASQASPPVDEARIAADVEGFHQATQATNPVTGETHQELFPPYGPGC